MSGLARSGWRLWLTPDRPPLLLLLYRDHLKVEGVLDAEARLLSCYHIRLVSGCRGSGCSKLLVQGQACCGWGEAYLLLLLLYADHLRVEVCWMLGCSSGLHRTNVCGWEDGQSLFSKLSPMILAATAEMELPAGLLPTHIYF